MMQQATRARVLVITGLPGTGKSTVATPLAARLQWPLLAKDAVKQPLLTALGAHAAPPASRAMSDASFAALFAFAGALLEAGNAGLVLEGNFRAGEHEAPLMAALRRLPATTEVHVGQLLCRVEAALRRDYVRARAAAAAPGSVHAGVAAQLGEHAGEGAVPTDRFLDVPGPKRVLNVTSSSDALAKLDEMEAWVAACM